MKKILVTVAVLLVAGLVYYLLVMRPSGTDAELQTPAVIEQPVIAPPTEAEAPATETLESEAGDGALLDSAEEQEALPALAESDPEMLSSLAIIAGEDAVAQNVIAENIIPRLVATVDALTGRQVPANLLPLQPPGGVLEVTEDTNPENPRFTPEGDRIREYLMDSVNFQRYGAYVDLLESVDTQALVATYLKYRPLFQQAYVELGYPDGDFNTRLLQVINQLLAAPEVTEPVRLVKPEAYYLFADPKLEALSAGEKLMIRMGKDNAQRVKRKLADFRTALESDLTTQ